MQVDRAGVQRRRRARRLDVADHLAGVGLDDRDRVDPSRAQRDPRGREALAARQVAAVLLAQVARPHELLGIRTPARAEEGRVVVADRQLIGRRHQVRQVDVLVLVVEDGRLDGAVEELLRVAAEELVERVVAGHVQGQPRIAAARTTPHLAQAGHRAGEGHADRGVEIAHVDAQLERVGGDHGKQLALGQAPLDLAPLLRRVAGAVGRDAVGQVAASRILEAQAGELLDQLDAAPRLEEADRSRVLLDQAREQPGGLRQRRRAHARLLVEQRRVPHRDLALGGRRAVAIDQAELEPRQPLGEVDRIRDRRTRQHEPRLGAVRRGQPAQAAQHVPNM